jgi:exodeoxyribonuclease VII large subunit
VRSLVRSRGFHRPVDHLRQLQQRLDALTARLERTAPRLVEQERRRLDALRSRLDALDPEGPLRRGFTFAEKEGRPVRSAEDLAEGDAFTLTFLDGTRDARVEASVER